MSFSEGCLLISQNYPIVFPAVKKRNLNSNVRQIIHPFQTYNFSARANNGLFLSNLGPIRDIRI